MAAAIAYTAWGLFPLYFKILSAVPPLEVLAHRISWSALLTLALVFSSGKGKELAQVFLDPRRLGGLAASALCISFNWACFIWAVSNGHTLDSSLGNFLYPLCAVFLGAVVLKERLNRRQGMAIALVCAGVAVLASGIGKIPWLVIAFPLSFVGYALLRKVVAVDALVGLAVETLLLTPFCLAYLALRPDGGAFFSGPAPITLLLAFAGPLTAVPLVLFAYGARRLKFSTLGVLQYLNPTIQMAVAVLAFGETFTRIHAVTFAFIWAGLALYTLPIGGAANR
ncbi:EamA family transporter RarD [Telmatospirillum siberiense]|uniref:EamA family transporter RarD n=1 Tax=Telmatospirillum siberiense TaxID=382514 RepID=UPI0018EC9D81|nr:EamA family transporter RarD [Telmatospirillum siberiense]